MTDKEKLDRLTDVALFALGWMMGKCKGEGLDSWNVPCLSLARALKATGTQCDYVDEILKRADAAPASRAKGVSV